MDSDFSNSSLSPSSSLPVISVKDNDSFSLNDVVAISNGEGGFLLGKVSEQRNDSFVLILYHYKLDTRTQLFKKDELIMNFGHAGAKTIFEMSSDHQKILLNRIHDPDQYSSSLLGLMVEIKKKDEDRHKMIKMITDLLNQLKITDVGHELLLNALQENILSFNEFIEMICIAATNEENDINMDRLADVVAKIAFEQKTLEFIENKMLNDSSAVQFLKKCLWKIGDFIGQINVDKFDQPSVVFTLHYVRLSATHWKS